MKLIRLSILRPLLLKRAILWQLENLKNFKDLYRWFAKLATQPYKCFKIFNFQTLIGKEPIPPPPLLLSSDTEYYTIP